MTQGQMMMRRRLTYERNCNSNRCYGMHDNLDGNPCYRGAWVYEYLFHPLYYIAELGRDGV